MKKVYFIRHGETQSNSSGLYQSPDVPLSDNGLKGALAVAERCTHLGADVVIASPFVRAQQTAACIGEHIGKPVVTFEHAHEVMNARTMWGKHFASEESQAYEEERTSRFIDPSWNFEGAENYYDVSKRVMACIEMLEQSQESNIIFVSHGNFLRFLIARLLLEKDDSIESNTAVNRSLYRMSNVGITEFMLENGAWKLFTWNDHAHFAE